MGAKRSAAPEQIQIPVQRALADAVDAAIAGDAGLDSPELQPSRQIAAGDFGSLYIRHRAAMQAQARRFLTDPHDVEDVVQETFLKLFLAIPELDTELQAVAFSRRVLTNMCIDRYRAAKRRPSVINLDTGAAEWITAEEEPSDPVVQAEDAAIVRQALAMLSPLHRAALVKREIEEKPLPVIADELGVPEDSVKHLLFRARRALRRALLGSTVDPAADITVTQAISVLNSRVSRKAVAVGHFVIVLLVVLGLGVAAGRSGMFGRHSQPQTFQAAGEPKLLSPTPAPSAPGVGGSSRSSHSGASDHTDVSGSHASTSAGRAAAGGTSGLHFVAPHQPRKTGGTPSGPSGPSTGRPTPTPSDGGGSGGSQPAYQLTGALKALSAPTVLDQQTVAVSGDPALFSRFIAPTTAGELQIGELITQTSSTPMSVEADIPVDGQSLQTVPLSRSAGSETLPDGSTQLTGVLNVNLVQSADSSALQTVPQTTIAVTMVVNPSYSSVLSETVNVATLSPSPTPSGSSTSGTTTQTPAPTTASPDSEDAVRKS